MSQPSPSRSRFFRWCIAAAVLPFAALWLFSGHVLIRDFHHSKAYGWTMAVDGHAWTFATVDPDGPAAGRLEPGDRLIALNGDPRAAVLGYLYFSNAPVGEIYRLDVERRGERKTFDLLMPAGPGRQMLLVFLTVSLAFFLCGASLGLLRPQDPQVRLIAVLLMAAACTTLLEVLGSVRTFLVGWERSVHLLTAALSLFTFPMTVHFFARFPEWRRPGPGWRAMLIALYFAMAVVFLPAWVVNFLSLDVGPGPTQFLADHPSLYFLAYHIQVRALFVFITGCLALAIVAAVRNYTSLRDPGSRRRVRWVVAGLVIGCAPFIVVIVLYRVLSAISDPAYRFWYPATFVTMLAIPAAFVMAVWKEQLFDVRVIVRRGLQYLFARTALQALLVLPVGLLLFSVFRNPNRTVAEVVTQGSGWMNVALFLVIGAALQSRQRLQTALDRRFFREAYQQEQVLAHLIDEIRLCGSLGEIAKLTGARIQSVLHPAMVQVLYRAEEHSDRFEGHSSSGSAAVLQLPPGAEALPADEVARLEALGVRLIVPIAGARERLVGVLLLGERLSDEPYSARDRQLLQALASQIGLVYENEHLKQRVRQDADVRRDVLARLEDRRVSLLKECPVCGACADGGAERCAHDGAELMLTLPIERTLDGKYRLERAIGRGGFGAVFEATDLRLDRRVAAKVMMGSLFGDRDALRRFEREARAAAKIDHPHITRVYDYGAIGSGGAFLVMELVAGRTWRAELQRTGVVAPTRAAEWFRQLLDGLQFAHALGIVHRDLKPENVMIVSTDSVPPVPPLPPIQPDRLKIMDFGLAKVIDPSGKTESVTVAGNVMGTLGYMAPEMLTGSAVDERADLFAIGVMVVETVTGRRPFDGATPQEVLTSLLRSDYHLPGDSPDARALDAVVQRCLAKDPRDRYASAAELSVDLIPILARFGGIGTRGGSATENTPTFGIPT